MEKELDTPAYLRDLAERLMRVPATYGTDQGDVDTLLELAREIEAFNERKRGE